MKLTLEIARQLPIGTILVVIDDSDIVAPVGAKAMWVVESQFIQQLERGCGS